MFTVYILHGTKSSYIGQTNHLQHRLQQHFTGQVSQSLRAGVTGLAHKFDVPSRYEALKLETYLQRVQRTEGESGLYNLIADVSYYTDELKSECCSFPDNHFQSKVKQLELEGKTAPGYAGELYGKI